MQVNTLVPAPLNHNGLVLEELPTAVATLHQQALKMLRTCTVTIAAMTLVAALVLGTEVWAGGTIQVGGKMTCKTPHAHGRLHCNPAVAQPNARKN